MHKEHLRITRSETSLKAEILRAATETLTGLSANQNEICRRLTHWETNFRQRKSVGLQVNDASGTHLVSRLEKNLRELDQDCDGGTMILQQYVETCGTKPQYF